MLEKTIKSISAINCKVKHLQHVESVKMLGGFIDGSGEGPQRTISYCRFCSLTVDEPIIHQRINKGQ